MPEGRDGGLGGKPFSRATSSRSAWFSVRSAVIVACCASTSERRTALSDRNRRNLADQHADEVAQLGKREALRRCGIRQQHPERESRPRPQRNLIARQFAPVTPGVR
jgi:hypothetical protein